MSKLSDSKRSWQFLLDYFLNSQDKWKARALLLGCVVSILIVLGLSFLLGWWCFPYIFAAFVLKDVTTFLLGVGAALLISGLMAIFNFVTNFLEATLHVNWRSWLTKKTISQYLNNKTNYLAISRIYPEIDNPQQRIQEDIDKVTESFLDLCLGFIYNFSNLVIFVVLLSLVGSSLSFLLFGAMVTIPGFLVFVALAVGIGTSYLARFISKPLRDLANQETIAQSNFRANVESVQSSAEEVAIEQGETYYQSSLNEQVDDLSIKTTKRLWIKNKTESINVFNQIFQAVVPFLAAAPLYFANRITLSTFYSISYYFSTITFSLNWFATSLDTVNKFEVSLYRLMALQQVLDKDNRVDSTKKIIRTIDNQSNSLRINNLNLNLHNSQQSLIKGLNLTFTHGIHTLVQASSGTGKSSLFKAIAGTWVSGEGEITIPDCLQRLYFLPQKPTLPNDTLRKVLAYPDGDCSYSDEELITALNLVNMGTLAGKLDEKIGVKKSLGEQQRIAFARVFLRKPDWIFLDEATASLDEQSEEKIYSRLKECLPKTTIISIAHRSTLRQYHDKIVFLKVDDTKQVDIHEMTQNLFAVSR